MTRSLESTDYKGRVEQEGVLTNCKEELATLVTLFLKYVKGNYIFFSVSTEPKLNQGCIKSFGENAF